ncbi:GIY-YIG nuclease family protein [Arthrobacter sp. STN4]|uniref:GIY-YIG nuclease family protein n=1 Tax=Arthrobacter sp. STN4 TaxID=2923276 RepID=UPI002119ECAC|nr:GIY-YIG nuclease family protein [Arthrobacter sp. STN4]MCQ9162954.1 GIY-YIG nuclease family protein [Arthrobacter sp. STN4]
MTITTPFTGRLTFGDIVEASGVDPREILLLRHTYNADGLAGPADLTPEKIHESVRWQGVRNKVGKTPPKYWLNFVAAGGRRSRFLFAYENNGEIKDMRTADMRCFDLRPSPFLSDLEGRLVVEWSKDAVNWAKPALDCGGFLVTEVADARPEPFPGFDGLVLPFIELLAVMEDSRYGRWRQALSSVQGIYLIADTKTGQLYVGKADGAERMLGRWSQYAKTGHGGNVGLRDLDKLDPTHRQHFQFSILRVFDPGASMAEVDAAESHYKRILLTRQFGLNRN